MVGRRVIILVAILLAILAAAAPLAIGTYLSRDLALKAARAYLAEYADWTLQRARFTISTAETALKDIGKHQPADCGPAHITRMREMSIDNASVESFGYLKDGRMLCNSWGTASAPMPPSSPPLLLDGGFRLHIGLRPSVSPSRDMMSLRHGDYGALIRPERMVDVLRNADMALGIATEQGQVIAISGDADPRLVQHLIGTIGTGEDDKRLFISMKRDGFIAFAIMDRATALHFFQMDLAFLVPTALAVSCALIGIIIWMSRQRLPTRSELQMAIRRGEFFAHYQPIIHLSTGRCVGAEALIRWRRPDGVWVAPDAFVPLAEQSGMIEAITDVMIRRVVGDLAIMLRRSPDIHVAVNVSASDLHSGRFLPVLAEALQRAGVPAAQVWLEATEYSFIDADAARPTIDKARAAGHLMAIDDFGTGYSSLALLETLPLDALKIDKSFVAAIGTEAARSVVMPHIIEMAAGLDLRLVAEGVETPEQEAYLKGAGVQYAQGFLYAKAMPPEAFAAFCEGHNGQLPQPA
ncbi:cyclic diguanylate phosphodiesterase [Azorhizobium oxalatiphilum]|uniref:cyclic-guanylate-specific phosphodiesterase n=1 Tax=Azorhizobium oxalatiphilum TaxID=980631 RepID=A0A917FE11_9HYPH|nr:EAL domain-containing protein [Azorhizobium oxalatiphilum]GGF72374.1 cyclic diguanylate phosphodiesterase [Azorhizobium oxalatiphilum]